MTLRRAFVVVFAAVAVAVAALVGALSYDVTARNLNIAVDQSLDTAATALQSGATLAPTPTGDPTGPRSGPPGGGHGHEGRSLLLFQAAQRLGSDGSVTALLGAPLPVDPSDLALAATNQSGQSRYRVETVGPTTYRVLTQSISTGGAFMVARDLDETDDVLGQLALEITTAGLAVLVVAAAAGWLIARRITRRLLRLTETAELVSATGHLDIPIATSTRDEVGRLATAFDTMLTQLARSRDDQRRLVQDAGHELRTPLTSLRTNLSVLRRFDELGPDNRRRLLDDLDSESRELSTLADELVELATDRRAVEQVRPVDLAELAERVAERFRRRTGRAITVDAAALTVVDGRPQALERAVSNLVDNAVKFDPAGAEPVQIQVGPDRIEVLDRGPGIDAADSPHVFERFYRATSARSVTGSGLGLAIVREIADVHGGSVFVTARPGGGTAVGFTLHPEAAAVRAVDRFRSDYGTEPSIE
jgi:two-component system sensor histidine kinase MprB